MSHKMRFLLLTSDSGFGHRSSAKAIARALEIRYPNEADTRIVNPIFRRSTASFLQRVELNYDQTVKDYSGWYWFFYEVSDKRSVSSLVENTLALALKKSVEGLIDEMQPDAVVSTNQMFNAPVGDVLGKRKRKIPFFTVITDLADVHAMWFNSSPDRFFVGSPLVKAKAVASGIKPAKIVVSGIPVDPLFGAARGDHAALRVKLGLDPRLATLLIVGSSRVSGIYECLKALESVPQEFQVVMIAGGDDDLDSQVRGREWGFPIHFENYVDNIPEWMLASDILITKAGGVVLSEGLAAGLPIVMIDHLPGQEEGNLQFIIDQGAGVLAKRPGDLSRIVSAWLGNGRELLEIYAMNSRYLGHPDSAIVIADALWKAARQEGTARHYQETHPVASA